jgi:hypothetical protein
MMNMPKAEQFVYEQPKELGTNLQIDKNISDNLTKLFTQKMSIRDALLDRENKTTNLTRTLQLVDKNNILKKYRDKIDALYEKFYRSDGYADALKGVVIRPRKEGGAFMDLGKSLSRDPAVVMQVKPSLNQMLGRNRASVLDPKNFRSRKSIRMSVQDQDEIFGQLERQVKNDDRDSIASHRKFARSRTRDVSKTPRRSPGRKKTPELYSSASRARGQNFFRQESMTGRNSGLSSMLPEPADKILITQKIQQRSGMTSRNLKSVFDGSIDNSSTTRGLVESKTPVPDLTAPLTQANSQRPSLKRNNLSNLFLRSRVTVDSKNEKKDDFVSHCLKSGYSNTFFVKGSGTVTKDLSFGDSVVNPNDSSRQELINNDNIQISQCTSKFSPSRSVKTKSPAEDSKSQLGRHSRSPPNRASIASSRQSTRVPGALRALMNKKYADQACIKQVQDKNLVALKEAETFKFKNNINLDKITEKDRIDIEEVSKKLMFASINKKLKEKNQIFNVDDTVTDKSGKSKVSTESMNAAEKLEFFLADLEGIESLDDYFLNEERLKIIEQNIVTKPLLQRLLAVYDHKRMDIQGLVLETPLVEPDG